MTLFPYFTHYAHWGIVYFLESLLAEKYRQTLFFTINASRATAAAKYLRALHKNALSDSISAAFYIFLRILLFLILRWSLYPIRQKRRRKMRGGALANGTYRLGKQRTAWSAKTLIGMQICRVPWRQNLIASGAATLHKLSYALGQGCPSFWSKAKGERYLGN